MRSCVFCAFGQKACKKSRAVVEEAMKFYIVTPTYNSLKWLRCCIRSVADQVGEGVEVHHHVQDGGSKDGTPEWLETWRKEHEGSPGYTFTYESCSDAGMYDALNKAWDKLPEEADVTAHLNSDEQYLPGALSEVVGVFRENAEADLVLATFIILNPDGSYHCHRRPVKPHTWSSRMVCEIITCTGFHKAATFRKHGVRFDISYKSIGDLLFFRDIMSTQPRVVVCPEMVTTGYAMTGENLAWTEVTDGENKRYYKTLTLPESLLHGVVRRVVNFQRRITDKLCPPPKSCAFYRGDSTTREVQIIKNPTCIWRIPR